MGNCNFDNTDAAPSGEMPDCASCLDRPRRAKTPGQFLLSATEWVEIAEWLALTPREWEIAVLVFEGMKREAVARRLQISPRTVRQHMERLHQKLGVHDRVGLVLSLISVRDKLRCQRCPRCGDTPQDASLRSDDSPADATESAE